jgi:hypothetical protein
MPPHVRATFKKESESKQEQSTSARSSSVSASLENKRSITFSYSHHWLLFKGYHHALEMDIA